MEMEMKAFVFFKFHEKDAKLDKHNFKRVLTSHLKPKICEITATCKLTSLSK